MPAINQASSNVMPTPAIAFSSSLLCNCYDARRRWLTIELIDQRCATPEHGALVDRALVGHFAGVDRGRNRNQQDAAHPRGAARAERRELAQQRREMLLDPAVGENC